MEIRVLQSGDYSAVRELYQAVRNEYLEYQRRSSGRIHDPIGLNINASELEFYIATRCSFVAIDNGQLLGFLFAQPVKWIEDRNQVLWLELIAVQAAHRRRGIGLALISAARNFAKSREIEGLFATLNIDNQESASLLLKAGFDVKDWRIASYPLAVKKEAISE